MITDPISDLFTRIRNAGAKGKVFVEVPHSKLKLSIVELMKNEGYIKSFFVADDEPSKKTIKITLKYINDQPVIKKIKRVSSPGQRLYANYRSIPKVLGGLGITILSTSAGLMTDRTARAKKMGGEMICQIY
ncbi:MAG TPA: 30S ribosomal protein S8 [bacterium]|nr:30S ribosomal protein S8 [bacterium]